MSTGTVLITGASSGLGEQMARQFADLGYDLALCARRHPRLMALKTEIESDHPTCKVQIASFDVTDDQAVATVFDEFHRTCGTIDRVIVNAGVGSGAALGTGRHAANRATAMTNFVGALTTAEYAMQIFRTQQHGHLVFISSISALRGMRKSMTTYAATKAGIAAIAEGLRAEHIPGIEVSVIYPGYIRSEMNAAVADQTRFMVDTETGVRAIVEAIEKRRDRAYVPRWPWAPIGVAVKHLPDRLARRLM
ncbi:SDR family oxidoreductase [Mycobacterium sp. 134]|uniref:SDR family oxidoreductase n=1 Tax=Mycobacterium sp. 134 TaxID=3400425 RepID=UPI003AAF39DD